jgi:hypothetical protein
LEADVLADGCCAFVDDVVVRGCVAGSGCSTREVDAMKRPTVRVRSRLFVEPLEGRWLLSNVRAFIDDGDLVIRGTHSADVVEVFQDACGVVVRGHNGTTINGEDEVCLSGFDDDLRIRLKGGHDQLSLHGLSVPDDAHVDAGRGDDILRFWSLFVGSDLRVFLEGGHDQFFLASSSVAEDLRVRGNSGNDRIGLAGASVGELTDIDTHGGDDWVGICDSTFDGSFAVDLGRGSDAFGTEGSSYAKDLHVDGGRGHDQFIDSGGNSISDEEDLDDLEQFRTDISICELLEQEPDEPPLPFHS